MDPGQTDTRDQGRSPRQGVHNGDDGRHEEVPRRRSVLRSENQYTSTPSPPTCWPSTAWCVAVPPLQCRENAVAESFFASLTLELASRHSWAQVRSEIVWCIEVFFNRNGLRSSLDYLTPLEYEAWIHYQAAQAA